MKKIAAIVIGMTILVIGVVPAFAHGHYYGGSSGYGGQRSTGYAVCTVQDCVLTGLHAHDGNICSAHYYGDGHDYHVRNDGYQSNWGYYNNYGHCRR